MGEYIRMVVSLVYLSERRGRIHRSVIVIITKLSDGSVPSSVSRLGTVACHGIKPAPDVFILQVLRHLYGIRTIQDLESPGTAKLFRVVVS